MLDHVLVLFSHSEAHSNFNISDVCRCIIPPVNLNQCTGIVEDGKLVAWASWGFLSRDKADIFLDGEYELAPEDWRSGDVPIFMDFVAPFGHAIQLTRDLRNLFPDLPKAEWRRHTKHKRVGVDLYNGNQ